MARLLAPRDFGLMALAAFFVMLTRRLREFSLNDVLIQQDDREDTYATHWSL
jgi:O-antigen/teichoic acid export membrane protein